MKDTLTQKETQGLGMPWEEMYGYAQAVRVGNAIYVSGQFAHDDKGELVGPAPVNESGEIMNHKNMRAQMKQTYENAKKVLDKFGLTLENVVEEVIYVTDMDEAFEVAGEVRKEVYGSKWPKVASTLLVTPRLAFPPQLVEIKFTAIV